MRTLLGLLAVLFLLAACASPQYLYYGNTSHSYYKAVKKQDIKSVDNYKQSLEKVFTRSAELGKPVPPGLYCDYALLLLQEKPQEAKAYLLKEKQAWKESEQLVDFLIDRYQLGK